jgi:ABC-2 type transport system ATP-binding protein
MPIIKTQGLTRRFNQLVAVDNLNLEINEGEIFGLVGPDGAGKTTTLRLLAGILAPTAGDAYLAGHSIIKNSEKIKEIIAYMPQRFGLYEDLTVRENMNFYAAIYGTTKQERAKRLKTLLDFTRLALFQNRLARDLSGGMKQKLGLACALIHSPRILLLDEPTNGVDPVSRREFWTILYGLLKEKVTIFFSTCYLDEAERCKRVGLLHKGKLLRCAQPEIIKQEYNASVLEDAFIKIILNNERK